MIRFRNRTSQREKPEAPAGSGSSASETPALRRLRQLTWLYFFLLIFEGALRKWFLPGLATPLLLIRDPVVIVMYAVAMNTGLFPRHPLVSFTLLLAALSLPVGLLQIVSGATTLPVLLFGLRTNFLHLPLIFLIPRILDVEGVRQLARWTLVLLPAMALLMVAQFKSGPDARINAAIGDGQQLESAFGRIRPAATFSFVTGTVSFLALAAAAMFHGMAERGRFSPRLIIPAGLSLAAALAVSGSRSALLGVVVVLACYLAALLAAGRLTGGLVRLGVIGVLVGAFVLSTDFLDDGIQIFTARWQMAADFEQSSGGVVGRALGDILHPLSWIPDIPFLGLGIGRGTNVGAQLLGTPRQFLLAEGEWARVLFENGALVGTLYVLLRILLVAWLGLSSWRAAGQGNSLPMMLFGACALGVLNGQFGQSTALGFATLVAGLCLAACRNQGTSSNAKRAQMNSPQAPERGKRERKFRKPKLNPLPQDLPAAP